MTTSVFLLVASVAHSYINRTIFRHLCSFPLQPQLFRPDQNLFPPHRISTQSSFRRKLALTPGPLLTTTTMQITLLFGLVALALSAPLPPQTFPSDISSQQNTTTSAHAPVNAKFGWLIRDESKTGSIADAVPIEAKFGSWLIKRNSSSETEPHHVAVNNKSWLIRATDVFWLPKRAAKQVLRLPSDN